MKDISHKSHLRQISLIIIIFSLVFISAFTPLAKANTEDLKTDTAIQSINKAFNNTLVAEGLGANVTSLLTKLNSAGELLSQAEMYSRSSSKINATALIENSKLQTEQVNKEALKLQTDAIAESQLALFQTFSFSLISIVFFLIILRFIWRRFKTSYFKNETNFAIARSQLDKYRKIFIVVALIGILLFASPIIGQFVKLPSNQSFSELYILGPNKSLEKMPFNIDNNEEYLLYVGVGNKLTHSSYYTVYVKLGPQKQPLPDQGFGLPSTLPPLYEYKLFLQNEESSLAPLIFKLDSQVSDNGASLLSKININGLEFPLNELSTWNYAKNGYYYELIIELWSYNATINDSQYSNRFVSLILNATSTGL